MWKLNYCVFSVSLFPPMYLQLTSYALHGVSSKVLDPKNKYNGHLVYNFFIRLPLKFKTGANSITWTAGGVARIPE